MSMVVWFQEDWRQTEASALLWQEIMIDMATGFFPTNPRRIEHSNQFFKSETNTRT
jgi:hypothetical protein